MHSVLLPRLKAIDGEMVKPAAQKFKRRFSASRFAKGLGVWGVKSEAQVLPLVVLRAGQAPQYPGRVNEGICKFLHRRERDSVAQPAQQTSELCSYISPLLFVLCFLLSFRTMSVEPPRLGIIGSMTTQAKCFQGHMKPGPETLQRH